MMRLTANYIFVLLILSACSEASRLDILPGNTGNIGEVIVVAPPEVWSTTYGDVIAKALNAPMVGLPQDEPWLKRLEVKESAFADHFQTHRNVLKIEVKPKAEMGVFIRRNVHARQQLFITISLNSLDDLEGVLLSRGKEIIQKFHEAEIDRLIDRNKAFGQKQLNKEVEEHTALNLFFQDKFQVAVKKDNFIWLRLDQSKPLGGYQHTISQGLLIYWRDYVDTSNFSDTSLFAWKNALNQLHVKGPQNSYMSISNRFVAPTTNWTIFQSQTAKEVRGLWRMEGYFMGGPFYALAFYHPETKRQYLVEGYAYAPQFDKAPLIREVEAIIKSADYDSNGE